MFIPQKICYIILFLCFLYTISCYEFQSDISEPKFADPDRYGHRYCAYWKMSNGVRLFSDCDLFETMRCGRPLKFEYRCCTQFQTVREEIFALNPSGKEKCAAVIPQWDFCPNVLSTATGYQLFGEYLQFGNFISPNSVNTYTIFAPYTPNEKVITDLYGKFSSKETNPILHHVVKNRIYSKDLKDGMTLDTVLGTKLKVNKYANGVTSVDCVELIEADLECRNGLIHMTKKPLLSPKGMNQDGSNIYKLLKSHPDTKSFANDIPADLQREMENVNSGVWYTVFAPSEKAWLSLRAAYPNAVDRQKIVRNHVLTKMLCSGAITEHLANLRPLSGGKLSAECDTVPDPKNPKRFNEVRYVTGPCNERRTVVTEDLVAVNGVAQILDDAIIPVALMQLKDVLKCSTGQAGGDLSFKKFVEYFKDCDLRMEPGKKYAVLMPNDGALDWWKSYAQFKPEYDRFLTDKEYRCRVARYHIMPLNSELSNITKLSHQNAGYDSNTIDERFQTNYLLKDQSQSEMYFHYSKVINYQANEFADGVIYNIDKINVIPEKNLVEQLKSFGDLSTVLKKVESSQLEKTVFTPSKPMNLYLAVKNSGWNDKNGKPLEEMLWTKEAEAKLQLLHTVPSYLWGGDIGYLKPNTIHKFMSRLGIELTFWTDADGTTRIGHDDMPDRNAWPKVIRFNIPATDGIMWILDGLLKCPASICSSHNMDMYNVFVAACISKTFGPNKADMTTEFKKMPYQVALANPSNCVYFQQPEKNVPDLD